MHKAIEVKILKQYRIRLKFDDGTEGIVDLSKQVGKGIFAIWNDYKQFKKVHIGSSGELLWNDSIDICPDSLYLIITGKKPEDIFPILKKRNN